MKERNDLWLMDGVKKKNGTLPLFRQLINIGYWYMFVLIYSSKLQGINTNNDRGENGSVCITFIIEPYWSSGSKEANIKDTGVLTHQVLLNRIDSDNRKTNEYRQGKRQSDYLDPASINKTYYYTTINHEDNIIVSTILLSIAKTKKTLQTRDNTI